MWHMGGLYVANKELMSSGGSEVETFYILVVACHHFAPPPLEDYSLLDTPLFEVYRVSAVLVLNGNMEYYVDRWRQGIWER